MLGKSYIGKNRREPGVIEKRMGNVLYKVRGTFGIWIRHIIQIQREKRTLDKVDSQATSLAQRLQKDLEEERALNRSLLINEKTWRERTEQAESEAKTARAECRELLLNLELRDKLNE
ncbi:unnamed protein product, partial [Schistosoma mattheei]